MKINIRAINIMMSQLFVVGIVILFFLAFVWLLVEHTKIFFISLLVTIVFLMIRDWYRTTVKQIERGDYD